MNVGKNYFVLDSLDDDNWYLRNNVLDTELAHSYLGNSRYAGFEEIGRYDAAKIKVVLLGGSTTDQTLYPFKMWGDYLWKLNPELGILNGGVCGYNSSDEIIKLIRDALLLKPNVIIVYDGINEPCMDTMSEISNGYRLQIYKFVEKTFELSLLGDIAMEYLKLIESVKNSKMETGIWGCGWIGVKIAYPFLRKLGVTIDFFVDNKVLDGREIIDGIKSRNINEIYEKRSSLFIFICVSKKYQNEIMQQLSEHGFSMEHLSCVDMDTISEFAEQLEYSSDEMKHHFWNYYDDRAYLENLFYIKMGYRMDFDCPKTFNEKLQWLKVYDRKKQYSTMVDKAAVKEYVASKISDIGIIETIGKWKTFDEIDFNSLPDKFVLKCTHDSGSVLVVSDRDKFNPEKARKRFNIALQKNYFYEKREWPYKDVNPSIIAEKYMQIKGKDCLPVYKFFCFNGTPLIIQAIENDKQDDEAIDYYDLNWKKMELRQNFPNSINGISKPNNLEKMIKYAQILSKGHPFIRVDFYEIDNKVYFSEFTFYSDAGFAKFIPEKWDSYLGKYIILPFERINNV